MKNYFTTLELLRDEKEFNTETYEWEHFTDDERETALDALKRFVATTGRGDRRRRIMDAEWYNVKEWGILRRLWYYPETEKVEYCCGQEWNSEMAILRDAFDWKVR